MRPAMALRAPNLLKLARRRRQAPRTSGRLLRSGLLLVAMNGLSFELWAGEPGVEPPSKPAIAERLKAAYPGIITSVNGNDVIFADGTALILDDGVASKSFTEWLEKPDIKDMFRQPYDAAGSAATPPEEWDPGRARNEAFFMKVYGDCRKGKVEDKLADVVWLPKKWGKKLKFTKVNGAAEHLKAVSLELDRLAKQFDVDLYPVAGTYNCRKVAGTEFRSPHGYGIAIDIALKHSSYWRWFLTKPDVKVKYRNAIPIEIVRVFEKHGFIWGGRWRHFDTMHFEYRPELLMRP
jgi:hypothetical protein